MCLALYFSFRRRRRGAWREDQLRPRRVDGEWDFLTDPLLFGGDLAELDFGREAEEALGPADRDDSRGFLRDDFLAVLRTESTDFGRALLWRMTGQPSKPKARRISLSR